MGTVETVLGPVDTAELGSTLMHEHVFVLSTEHVDNYGHQFWDEQERVDDAVAKLRTLAGRGVRTIVDPTVWGLGRYIPRIQTIAAQVPEINIIVATGLYTYDVIPHQYEYRGPGLMIDMPDPMISDFSGDITDGIAGTGVKAAFLKCAVEVQGLTPGVDRTLRVCAAVSVATGAPITVHTSSGARMGRPVIGVLRELGVDLTKVVIGHAGDSNDLDYLMELADTGALLGMDRFGLDIYNPTDRRIATIAALAGRGYADRMVLAHDASCFIDYFPGEVGQAAQAAMAPNWHYTHISDDVLPALLAAGVDEKQIDLMMVENPRRYFERS